MKKPLYQRILASKEFQTRVEAEEFAKDMKAQYKQADLSIKHDISRTENSGWKAVVFVKV